MDLPIGKVRKIIKIAQEPISLETPIGEEEDSHLGDFIEDKIIPSPPDTIIHINLREQIEEALKTLTDFGNNQLGFNTVYKEELTK